ncbi:MAG: hypothetical protein CMP67_00475 [Flavobacteriales bacterium]|mgnify:CR=1 FL=1|nr:hypothetical protein [Flavobacteriales bacterium]
MRNFLKIIILIFLISISVLLTFVLINQKDIQSKLENTNRLLFNQKMELKISDLLKKDSLDIVLGEYNADNSIIIYLRYGCSACDEYYKETLSKFNTQILSDFKLSLTFRFLAHDSKPEILKFSETVYQAQREGFFGDFMNEVFLNKRPFRKSFEELKSKYHSDLKYLDVKEYVLKKSRDARNLSVLSTPTSFVNGKRVTGSISKERLIQLLKK